MIWQEALIDRVLTDDDIAGAVAGLLPVPPHLVQVTGDIAEANVRPEVRVLCERGPGGGQFPQRIAFYVRDPTLETEDATEFIARFCQRLGCRCLISEGSPNPYRMVLVEGPGRRQPVSLDPQRLDEAEEYVLLRPKS